MPLDRERDGQMTKDRTMLEAMHAMTHRVPVVPRHRDHPEGHQGATRHGRSHQHRPPRLRGAGPHQASAHDRPPRVLVGWQNWIASLFSQKAS
jgi:hypothetical protein